MARTIITEKDIQNNILNVENTYRRDSELDDSDAAGLLDFPASEPGGAVLKPTMKTDDYNDRLTKYIPAEVIALYVTLEAIVGSAAKELQAGLSWFILAVGLLRHHFIFGEPRR